MNSRNDNKVVCINSHALREGSLNLRSLEYEVVVLSILSEKFLYEFMDFGLSNLSSKCYGCFQTAVEESIICF